MLIWPSQGRRLNGSKASRFGTSLVPRQSSQKSCSRCSRGEAKIGTAPTSRSKVVCQERSTSLASSPIKSLALKNSWISNSWCHSSRDQAICKKKRSINHTAHEYAYRHDRQ